MAMLSFRPAEAFGYGRVLRGPDGSVTAIREQRDASEAEAAVGECNSGVYCVEAKHLRRYIPTLGTNNAQGEMYLTDLIAAVRSEGRVVAIEVDHLEVAGVNTPEQLAVLEVEFARRGR
jgi:bifunctional UDP-N-acetylglucosamine pyrophosphorylase/glucosamine-1-phosphate N-acetyltransferase